MLDSLTGFVVVGVAILVGWVIARIDLLGPHARHVLGRLTFFVLSPFLLFVVLAQADVHMLFSALLPVSAIAGLQVLCRSVLAGPPPTVLARDETLGAALARMPAGRRYTSLVPTQLRRFLDVEPDGLRAFDAVLVGGTLTLCTQCALRRGIGEDDVLPGVRLAGAAVFVAEVTADGAQALVY